MSISSQDRRGTLMSTLVGALLARTEQTSPVSSRNLPETGRKLSFMRMKPNLTKAKLNSSVKKGPPNSPASPIIAPRSPAVLNSPNSPAILRNPPKSPAVSKEFPKPDQSSLSNAAVDSPKTDVDAKLDQVCPSPAVIKPVAADVTETEEIRCVEFVEHEHREDEGKSTPRIKEPNKIKAALQTSSKRNAKKQKVLRQEVIDGQIGDSSDSEKEEICADNHPTDNIMILKRRATKGCLRRNPATSKLIDWKKEAMEKFDRDDPESAFTMRDLIFFRGQREKKCEEEEEAAEDTETRENIFSDDPFSSVASRHENIPKSENVIIKREETQGTVKSERCSTLGSKSDPPLSDPAPVSADVLEENEEEVDDDEDIGAPKVKIGADGSIILDEESLVVRTKASKEADKMKNAPVIHDPDSFMFVSEDRRRNLAMFYRALSVVGTDFSMMEALFTNRTRKELKSKYRVESRRNPKLVDRALTGETRFDLALLPEFQEIDKEKKPAGRRKRTRRKSVDDDDLSVNHDKIPNKKQQKKIKLGTLSGVPEKKRRGRAKKAPPNPDDKSTADPDQAEEPSVSLEVSFPSPRVSSSLPVAVPVPNPIGTEEPESQNKTFAEMTTLGSSVACQTTEPASMPSTSKAKIVICSTVSDLCSLCPKFSVFAPENKNLSESELQEAIAEGMRHVSAERAKSAAIPASKHGPRCPNVFPEVSKSVVEKRSDSPETLPGLFSVMRAAMSSTLASSSSASENPVIDETDSMIIASEPALIASEVV
ncbi:unnamed protein product [Notodromas monacha]|uniref:Transcription factor TFIIIB component B'' Myb domain-containing protein n=1 Tax=Notodromas monacha TaxID=399045 RepID=A0A7R9BE91_9CRUS|nr:unnamed protein product [Notodromas monacha]CAG0913781.1 unnamed protein product [Notodromas monacha]